MGTHRTSALLALVLIALALLASPSAAFALDDEPTLSEAQAAIVVDQTGKVLYEKNPDEQINMASITKIMTAVVALESGTPLDTVCTLSAPELAENAMVAGYTAGSTSTLYDLMRVMLVYSANDAAWEVAQCVGGSQEAFVAKMNEKAKQLGMNSTHFENPHGLDAEGHHSTVHDLAILARYAMTTQPFIADTVRLPEVTVEVNGAQREYPTVDHLLGNYHGLIGIKTGAGNTVTAFMGAARRGGTTLYTVVLGCATVDGRFADTASLLNWAYGTYKDYELANSSLVLGTRPFSYNLAFSLPVQAGATTRGLIWPDGGDTTYTRTACHTDKLCDSSEVVGTCTWNQDGRSVGSVSYACASRPTFARSEFGLASLMCPAIETAV